MITLITASPKSLLADILADIKSGHIQNVEFHSNGQHLTVTTGLYARRAGFDYQMHSNPDRIEFKLYDLSKGMTLAQQGGYHVEFLSSIMKHYGIGVRISAVSAKI